MQKDDSQQYLTLKEAAAKCNLKYWQLQRAVRSGHIPSYTFNSKRRRVRLSDILAGFKPVGS
jgi:excisionase family DNA binding protein